MPRIARLTTLSVAVVMLGLAGLVAACGTSAPTPRLVDPSKILTESAASLSSVKTVHVSAKVVQGQVPGSLLSGLTGNLLGAPPATVPSPGSSLSATSSGDLPLDLSGTSADGDVDVSHANVHLKLVAPSSLLGVTVDMIKTGADVYAKSALIGPAYFKLPVPAGSVPLLTDPVSALRSLLADALARPGVQATFDGIARVNGKDAYHVIVRLPQDQLDSALAGTGASLQGATLDVWSYFDDMRPAQLELKATSSGAPLDVTASFTNYDRAVSISPPPADKISSAPPF